MHIYNSMSKILDEYVIDYIKWDMNRSLTDINNAKQAHEYVLGVYDLYNRLTTNYPQVIIEGCASGGGRFDSGILYYSPMIWTSDNTDAWERSKIQYSTSLCFPLQAMSNHVSASPNIQIGRVTPLKSRIGVASLGTLGYEFCVKELNDKEREEILKQNIQYKKDARLILTGDLYRLRNPFTDNSFCEIVVSENKSEAYFVFVHGLSDVVFWPKETVKLKGLKPNAKYCIVEKNEVVYGEELLNLGLTITLERGDFVGEILHIQEVV